jgi:small subunit ribosomal protein S3Ae
MAKESAQALKVRKKKWFSILAPGLFREVVVGEMPLYESIEMKGRCVTANMMNLTNNPRNQHINVKLRIVDVKDGKGLTQVLGAEMTPGSVKRLMRRGRTKVEDSFVVQTSDKKLVRLKPLIITNSVEKNSATAAIRKIVRNAAATLIIKLTYEQLLEEIVSFKLQRHLGEQASKITRIRSSEIRAFLLIERPGAKPITPTNEQIVKEKEEFVEEEEDAEKKEKTEEQPTQDEEASEAEEEPEDEVIDGTE